MIAAAWGNWLLPASPLYGALFTFVFGLAARPNRKSLRPLILTVIPLGLVLSLLPIGAYTTGGWLLGMSWGRGGRWRDRVAAVAMLAISVTLSVRRS